MIEYPLNLAPREETHDIYKGADSKKTYDVADPYRYMENPDDKMTQQWI